jgi:hypothetical protein
MKLATWQRCFFLSFFFVLYGFLFFLPFLPLESPSRPPLATQVRGHDMTSKRPNGKEEGTNEGRRSTTRGRHRERQNGLFSVMNFFLLSTSLFATSLGQRETGTKNASFVKCKVTTLTSREREREKEKESSEEQRMDRAKKESRERESKKSFLNVHRRHRICTKKRIAEKPKATIASFD